ncbi:hypothetical protein [Nocardiopsis protaetiae]|uniref:hypothetical protein n=1 Tax=Nocardiopsis protaetiae TaxID=3382270 RepID=UPI00387AB90D
MTLTCRLCAADIHHGTVCAPCVGALAADLRALWATGSLHGLDVDLDITIARMDVRPRTGSGGKPSEAPLPINDAASDIRRDLHACLAGWCRILIDDHGAPVPADTIPGMARLLHSQIAVVRVAEWGDSAVEEIRSHVARVRHIINRPAERVFAGTCPECQNPVYAPADHTWARCRVDGCEGRIDDIEERREQTVAAAREAAPRQRLTIAQAAMAARAMGHPVTEQGIRKAVAAGRIAAFAGRPVRVLLGDVLGLRGKRLAA